MSININGNIYNLYVDNGYIDRINNSSSFLYSPYGDKKQVLPQYTYGYVKSNVFRINGNSVEKLTTPLPYSKYVGTKNGFVCVYSDSFYITKDFKDYLLINLPTTIKASDSFLYVCPDNIRVFIQYRDSIIVLNTDNFSYTQTTIWNTSFVNWTLDENYLYACGKGYQYSCYNKSYPISYSNMPESLEDPDYFSTGYRRGINPYGITYSNGYFYYDGTGFDEANNNVYGIIKNNKKDITNNSINISFPSTTDTFAWDIAVGNNKLVVLGSDYKLYCCGVDETQLQEVILDFDTNVSASQGVTHLIFDERFILVCKKNNKLGLAFSNDGLNWDFVELDTTYTGLSLFSNKSRILKYS